MPGAQVAIDRRPDHVFGGRKGRRLAVTGTKKTLVLRVNAPDVSTTVSLSELSDSIFGTSGDPVNLRSQYKACSFNKLDFEPVNGASSSGVQVTNGAYDVFISQVVTNVDNGIVRDAVITAGNTALGNMESQYNHVIQCIPSGTSGGWLAYAYLNYYLSVYNDNWCTFVSAQMHEVRLILLEFLVLNISQYKPTSNPNMYYPIVLLCLTFQIGHNLGLVHSGKEGNEYKDESGMMGFSFGEDDTPEMCFNAVKNWELGWYADRHVEVGAPFSWSGNLYGFVDYGSTSSADNMIVRLISSSSTEDIYVSFNKAVGINIGTKIGINQVLVHTKVSGPAEVGQSWLLAELSSGQSFSVTIDGKSIPIVVNEINNGVASVLIGDPVTDIPTPSPQTNQPSPSGVDCGAFTSGKMCKTQSECTWFKGFCISNGSPPSPPSPPSPSPPSPSPPSPPSPTPPSPSPPTNEPTCSSYTGGGECKANGCIWRKGVCIDPIGTAVLARSPCEDKNIFVQMFLQVLGDEDCDGKF